MSRGNVDKVRSQFKNAESVTPLPTAPSERARQIADRIELAADLKPVLERDYVVKGWLDRNAISVVYGSPNTGKSFWAIDVAAHVHQGFPWGGCKVRAGAVLYCAAEGGAMFDNRLVAASAKFCVLRGGLTFTGRKSDVAPLAQAITDLAKVHGDFSLIVVDTLARVMGGGDENAAPDIAQLVKAADDLRDATGAHIMFIHHSGKDTTRGARGHSSLRAAVDTEIELTVDDDGHCLAKTTKQRDMQSGAEFRFELETVTLGRDSDGDPVTNCRIKHKGDWL